MKLTKCANGHFYDAEKYSSCPHCAGAATGGNVSSVDGDMKTDCLVPPHAGSNSVTQNVKPPFAGGNQGMDNETVGFDTVNRRTNPTVNINPQPARNNDDNKTVAYMARTKEGEPTYVKPAVSQNRSGQPVVGWLVCIEGEDYGNSFNIYGGKNFIGRSTDMDISLASDITVSRVKHAIVIYEPKGRKFFVQPGESHELFYLNDSVVLESTQIKDRDVLTIGKTTLVFVPFCDETYGWEK